MQLYTFAYIVGIVELIIFIPVLVSGTKAAAFMQKFASNDLAIRSLGAIMTIIAVLVLLGNWSIGSDPAGLVRLVAWATLIKGVLASWYPDILRKNMSLLSNANMRLVIAVVGIVIGVLLVYAGGIV
ncbi:hypothetical protein KKC44_04900 [Patescibacteria group bacterium]|nr:hypothetical protein [Patescibacteria group bacterium]